MNLSQMAAISALNGMAALYNNATLNIYSGIMPGNPEIPVGYQGITNTLLAKFTFAATAFPSPVFDGTGYLKAQASFVTNPVTPAASGTANFARAVAANTNVIEDRTAAQPWQASLPVVVGQFIMAGTNTYVCSIAGTTAASGAGPTGNGANIRDGTAYWQFHNSGSPDVLLTSAALSTATPLSLPYFWLAVPCA